MTQTKEETGMANRQVLNDLLSETFNSILRIEERSLDRGLTAGLTISEVHTIEAVGLHECKPMKAIAARLNITLATLTSAISKLERKGFVERKANEADRRQVLIQLTTKGREAFKAHESFHAKLVEEALATLSREEEFVFLKALTSVKDFFDREDRRLQSQ